MPAGAELHIGTSGWHYKHWLGEFYPAGFRASEMFAWYAREFHTVEINNTFYRLPEEKTFVAWRNMAPPQFLFALKASRFLTHLKRLKDPVAPVELFLSRAKHLRPHLGPVLFQLPPRWRLDLGRLAEFLKCLPRNLAFAIEFRDLSWYADAVYQLLGRHNVALCLHDWGNEKWPQELTADFTYVRFHGMDGRYGGSYPERVLALWARLLEDWMSRSFQVFVYFNNDIGGHAIRNARCLRAMLRGAGRRGPKPMVA
jgi:uncharacterized protein YecE (DUF72 family)